MYGRIIPLMILDLFITLYQGFFFSHRWDTQGAALGLHHF
jgi:hypothetical protein